MQLQSRLQSPKNCSWIKNRLAAVRQPLSRHWYDWEKLPASSVQYYVPLNLPRHGLTQQQSPAAGCDRERDRELQQPAPVQLTAGSAASRSRTSRVELDGRGGVVFPFQVLRRTMHRYTRGQACGGAGAGKRSIGRTRTHDVVVASASFRHPLPFSNEWLHLRVELSLVFRRSAQR